MKYIIVAGLLLLNVFSAMSQIKEQQKQFLLTTDSVMTLFYQGATERMATIAIDRYGKFTETDSTHGYQVSFDILDIDFSIAELISIGNEGKLALSLQCKDQSRCMAYREFGRRLKYIYYFNVLMDDQGNDKRLQQQLEMLLKLQHLLNQQSIKF